MALTSPWAQRLVVGCDHNGLPLKLALLGWLQSDGFPALDYGGYGGGPVDYPDIAGLVARAVAAAPGTAGLLIDAFGVGSSIAANKIHGVRAACAHDLDSIRSARAHSDANVLCLGARLAEQPEARRLVETWLSTPFDGGRHIPRLEKLAGLERTASLWP